MKKILYVLLGFILLTGIGFLAFLYSAPLPPETDAIIDEVLQSKLPDLYAGTPGKARSGDLEIWYESIGDPSGPAVLLISGASDTALGWSADFYQPLVDAGYHVIRYDNRGAGLSDWVDNWNPNLPYSLEDMAGDAVAVLDGLQVEKAHVIGMSMGGMIGQRMAISRAERVLSLTSIMSSGSIPDVPMTVVFRFVRVGLLYGLSGDERATIKRIVGVMQLLQGDGEIPLDVRAIAQRTLFELRKRNGFNPQVVGQHSTAVEASGSRLEELGQIDVPTLVVHGTEDPLVTPKHARQYAPLIPGAELLWVEGMGHELPKAFSDEVIPHLLELLKKADETQN